MAGLSAAWHLQNAGFTTTVFEKHSEVGGRTISIKKDGYIMDPGAITLSPAYKETLQLLHETGAGAMRVHTQPVLAIARDEILHYIDLSKIVSSGLKTGFLSLGAKLKLFRILPTLLRYWSKCDFEDMAQLEVLDIENCESFAIRKLGKEIHDYLVDPVIRMNMFSSTKTSSAVDIIWLMKMFSGAEFVQIKGGMGALSENIAAQLGDIRLNAPVEKIEMIHNQVVLQMDGEAHKFDAAVIAIPPELALNIAPWMSGRQRNWFDKIKGVPSLTVHVGLKSRPDCPASLVMVPGIEAKDVLGIVLEHNKCPGRAPEGKGLIALHMTGKWAETQRDLDDLQVAHNALDTVKPFMGDLKDQVEMVNLHNWEYVDHERYVGVYKSLKKARPEFMDGRVTFAGEFISAGIEGAVICGRRCAEALTRE